MSQQFIRIKELASVPGSPGRLPVSPATLWRWIAAGKFPRPFKLGDRITVWDAGEVEAFLASQQAGAAK
jgi:prophage regulatory protein